MFCVADGGQKGTVGHQKNQNRLRLVDAVAFRTHPVTSLVEVAELRADVDFE